MVEEIRQGDIPGVQLRCRQTLATSPEDAWIWLTDNRRLVRWLADRAEVEPGSAGGILLESMSAGETSRREKGTTLEIDPPRRWVLSFRQLDADWPAATRLTIELGAADLGCELSVLQAGFAHLPLSDCLTIWETYRRRWRTALARLAELVNEG